MLTLTHQLSSSLRHRLASRLESSLQNMHTPRSAPDPDPMLSINAEGFENEWAIFKHENLGFANRTSNAIRHQVNDGVEGSAGARVNPMGVGIQQTAFDQRVTGNGTEYAMASEAENDGGWLGTGSDQYSDAWQSTLFRLLGNAEFSNADNG